VAYQVHLEVFEGPFDLLLHLIAKRELDVYEVSLASITEEYLDYIKGMQELDLEVATEFLVVAATLIEIKAARLLPGAPVDEEDAFALTERDLLIARLLEYRAFKDAATRLADLLSTNTGFIARTAGPGREFDHLCPDLLARVSPQDLATMALRALTPKPAASLDLSHITPIRVSVAEAIASVLAILRERPKVTFRELTEECSSRIDIVVRFLAVLELVKRDEAHVEQAQNFGDILVGRSASFGTSAELAVDEYEGAPSAQWTEEKR
jgi:segregation and condensation protein A